MATPSDALSAAAIRKKLAVRVISTAPRSNAIERSSVHTFDRRSGVSRGLLLEFLAAEINGVHGTHVDDIVEGIFIQYEQVGGLALG